jgi:hypothetical protein
MSISSFGEAAVTAAPMVVEQPEAPLEVTHNFLAARGWDTATRSTPQKTRARADRALQSTDTGSFVFCMNIVTL